MFTLFCQSCMMQINAPMMSMFASSYLWVKTCIASWNSFLGCKAILFTFPRNADTVSHPLSALNKGRAASRGPTAFNMSRKPSHWKSEFLQKPINNLSTSNLVSAANLYTATSMSVLLTYFFLTNVFSMLIMDKHLCLCFFLVTKGCLGSIRIEIT